MTERKINIDFLKGILIICVIWGHTSSTFMGGVMYNLDNWLNLFFCSFHMPLFMGVSGYLFFSSVEKHRPFEIIRSRVQSILFPAVLWTVVYSMPSCVRAFISGNTKEYSVLIWNCRNVYWYLWSLFVCAIVMIACNAVTKKKHLLLLIGLVEVVFLLLPNDPIYLEFMWPFFSAGYLWKRREVSIESLDKCLLYACAVLFFVMLCGYTDENTVYVKHAPLIEGNINQLYYSCYRVIIGILGGLVISYLCHVMSNGPRCSKIKDWIEACGKNSLALYVLHVAGNYYISVVVTKGVSLIGSNPLLTNMWIYNLIITPIITVLYMGVLLSIIKWLLNWKLSKGWIFGLHFR